MVKSKKKPTQQKNSIDNYFGKTKNSIYVQRLREEIDDNSTDVENQIENQTGDDREGINIDELTIAAMAERIKVLEEKNEKLLEKNAKLQQDNCILKKMLDSSKNLNLCKDVKIQKMSRVQTAMNVQTKEQCTVFSTYANLFSTEQLSELRKIKEGKRLDGPFIAKCLEFLYCDDMRKIATKVSGKRKMKNKTTITPQKKFLIESLLNERIESEGVDEAVLNNRSARLTRLLGDGIQTLTRRLNTEDIANVTTSTTTTLPATAIMPSTEATPVNAPVYFSAQPFNCVTIPFYSY